MVGESNHDRAYLMALSAWKTFQHTSEPYNMFARRIAMIGEAKGLSAAAEAIAEDCRAKGLQMSAGRVLKSLESTLGRHREQLRSLKSVEDFQIEEIGKIPPGIADILDGLEPSRDQNALGLPSFHRHCAGRYCLAHIPLRSPIIWLS